MTRAALASIAAGLVLGLLLGLLIPAARLGSSHPRPASQPAALTLSSGGADSALDALRLRHASQQSLAGGLRQFVDSINSAGNAALLRDPQVIEDLKNAVAADPRAALDEILRISPALGRDSLLATLFPVACRANPWQAMAFYEELPAYLRGPIARRSGAALGTQAGFRAIEAAQGHIDSYYFFDLIHDAAHEWAIHDPLSATSELLALSNSGLPNARFQFLIFEQQLLSSSPAGLTQVYGILPANATREKIFNASLAHLASGKGISDSSTQDLAGALRLAEARPDGPERLSALAAVARGAAEGGLRDDALDLTQQLNSYEAKKQIYTSVADSAFAAGHPEAASYAQSIANPLVRYDVETEVVQEWVLASPATAAHEFVQYAVGHSADSPEWLGIISDWYPQLTSGDPNATCPSWINNLPQEDRQKLLSALRQQPTQPPVSQ